MRSRNRDRDEEKELRVSFISKKDYTCPVCGELFHKEELLSGGGRLIAGSLTPELHRLYEPSLKYGEVYPLVYQAVVCPYCWFASMEADFAQLPPAKKGDAGQDKERRQADTRLIFPDVDFNEPRRLFEGAASQYLVMLCYDYYGKLSSPTVKQAIATIRAAWLFDDLDRNYPGQHYDWLGNLFRRKAEYFYNEALNREQTGRESMTAVKNFGPDTDKNYSYEGLLYMCAYLRYKFGSSENMEERKTTLESARITIAKLFGMGRKSKDKPGVFLDQARKVYDAINQELETFKT